MQLAASVNFNEEIIWKNINIIKNELVVGVPCIGNLVTETYMKKNNEKFAKLLMYNISKTFFYNVTETQIQIGGEMFVALNSCPPYHLRLYRKAINGSASRVVMLALNIIKNAPENFKSKAIRIFEKIISVLDYQYVNIGKDGKSLKGLKTNLSRVKAEDVNLVQTVSNHPVHILDNNGNLSPSSLIPFCSFGEDLSLVGTYLDYYDFPVCKIFKPKVHHDQLCYQADLEKFRDNNRLLKQIARGFTFLIDFNEERQIGFAYKSSETHDNDQKKGMFDFEVRQTFSIFLDTISTFYFKTRIVNKIISFFSSGQASRRRELQYKHFKVD